MRSDAPDGMATIAEAIRELRIGHGLTQEQLGNRTGYSRSQVNNVEHAFEMPRPEFLTKCDRLFGTGSLLTNLRARAERRGFPSWAQERIEYEARAKAIEVFQTGIIHGFLQTADYARAVLSGGLPGDVPEEAMNAAVEGRLRRHDILKSGRLEMCHVILDESCLHHLVGGADVLREQLGHILDMIETRLVTVQVLPFSAGVCDTLAPVSLITLDDGTRMAYLEMAIDGQTTSNPTIVQGAVYRLDVLRVQAASLGDSAKMIRARMEEL